MTRRLRGPRLALLAAATALAIAVTAALLGAALAGDDKADQLATARAQLERSEGRSASLTRELSTSRARDGRVEQREKGGDPRVRHEATAERRGRRASRSSSLPRRTPVGDEG